MSAPESKFGKKKEVSTSNIENLESPPWKLSKTDFASQNGKYKRSRTRSKLPERILRSFLDIEISSILISEEMMTGYDLVIYLYRKYGILFSPGTIYPILHGMEKEELIIRKISGRRRPYVMTEKGRRWYEVFSQEFPGILKALNIIRKPPSS